MGGGGASGSSGTPSNTSGQAVSYQPTAQPQADIGYQSLLGGFFGGLGPSFSGTFGGQPGMFSGTPGGMSYGYAQPFVGTTGSGTVSDPNNPYYLQALAGALQAASGAGSVLGAGQSMIPGVATDALNQSSGIVNTNTVPTLAAIQSELPQYIQQAQGQTSNIANLIKQLYQANSYDLSGTAPMALAEGGAIANQINQGYGASLANANDAANRLGAFGDTMLGYGNTILNTGFDPQGDLFAKLSNQVAQQAQAANAASGLGASPYGASTAGNTLSNFDINWQNAQLARQAQALSGASGAEGTAASAFGTQAGLPLSVSTGTTAALQGANQLPYLPLQQGGAISQAIANLASQSNLLPSQVESAYTNLAGALAPQQYQPISAYASTLGQVPSLLSSGATLTGLPYGAQTTGTSNALQALGSYTNLGNQQYTIPQQVANDLQSYLQLGQAASGLSGQLGALGLQENQMGLAGIGSALGAGSNLLFGNQGLSGALGLGNAGLLGSSGLFGGGGAAAGLGGLTAGTGPLDVGGGGELASGLATSAVGAADAGGGAGLASFLPFAGFGS